MGEEETPVEFFGWGYPKNHEPVSKWLYETPEINIKENRRLDVKFQIYEDKKDEWRWRLIASNGRIIGTSGEGYIDKFHCDRMVAKIKGNVQEAKVEWPEDQ